MCLAPREGPVRRPRSGCPRSSGASRILVIEDDPAVQDVVERALSREGFDSRAVEDGEAALERLGNADSFDLVILDVTLPGMDGASLYRELWASDGANREVPVIMLTARDDETSVVVGLEVGADDYITRPFSAQELVSRVRAQLRRRTPYSKVGPDGRQQLAFPGLEIDLLRREAAVDGTTVELTAREFDVPALLASHPGRVYGREQIMGHLWDGDFHGELRAADIHVGNLRRKIEPNPRVPRYIQTVRGTGHRFADI